MDAPTAALSPGTRLGDWLLQEHAGGGSYGTVYRAMHADNATLSGAVKIARYPLDPRFRREAAVLELLRHPHIPRLLDTGIWKSPQGLPYPYLVMEWVEGASLYEWERVYGRPLSSRQVLRMVGQVARALEAVHVAGGVHRDVKGDNVRVSPEGQATLVDFGGCWMEDARPLTEGGVGPGTEAYRSPQVVSFRRRFEHEPQAHYVPRRADDIYALGVTVYRLLTGVYPPRGRDPVFTSGEEESEGARVLVPPSALASGVEPRLEEWVLASLSEASEERPSAHRLAVEAEQAAGAAGAEADEPVVRYLSEAPEEPPPAPRTAGPKPRASCRWRVPLRARLAARMLAVVGAAVLGSSHPPPGMGCSPAVPPEAGSSGVGEEMLTSYEDLSLSDWESGEFIAREIPKKPLEGQRRPPCALRGEHEINDGCWIKVAELDPPCGEFFEYNNACYVPSPRKSRPPTSDGKDAQ